MTSTYAKLLLLFVPFLAIAENGVSRQGLLEIRAALGDAIIEEVFYSGDFDSKHEALSSARWAPGGTKHFEIYCDPEAKGNYVCVIGSFPKKSAIRLIEDGGKFSVHTFAYVGAPNISRLSRVGELEVKKDDLKMLKMTELTSAEKVLFRNGLEKCKFCSSGEYWVGPKTSHSGFIWAYSVLSKKLYRVPVSSRLVNSDDQSGGYVFVRRKSCQLNELVDFKAISERCQSRGWKLVKATTTGSANR